MQFFVEIKPGSFLAMMGRARSKAQVSFMGVQFQWSGQGRAYRAGPLADLPPGLVNSPEVWVQAVGRLPTEPSIPAAEAVAPAVQAAQPVLGRKVILPAKKPPALPAQSALPGPARPIGA